jgi:hypothetical protein
MRSKPPFFWTRINADLTDILILFGGVVQEILDYFADYILPSMKPLGFNPLTGEKVLDPCDRTDVREIEDTKRKINEHQFIWLSGKNSAIGYLRI